MVMAAAVDVRNLEFRLVMRNPPSARELPRREKNLVGDRRKIKHQIEARIGIFITFMLFLFPFMCWKSAEKNTGIAAVCRLFVSIFQSTGRIALAN
jgi:hypothetical protein